MFRVALTITQPNKCVIGLRVREKCEPLRSLIRSGKTGYHVADRARIILQAISTPLGELMPTIGRDYIVPHRRGFVKTPRPVIVRFL